MSEKVRYVIGADAGFTAKQIISWASPLGCDGLTAVLYKLVPVSLASVRRQAARERKERKARK